jgi:hypothetical protein
MEDMRINVPRIYVSLDNKKYEFQSILIEVEGKLNNQTIVILIDSGASQSYLYPEMVEIFHFPRRKIGKSWLVYLTTGAKRKFNEVVKACPMDMNGLGNMEDFNIIPLGSYELLIGMDWWYQHHAILDYYNNEFTCLDEEGNLSTIQGIPREIILRDISTFQLKKSYKKGCQICFSHMEETPKDKVPNIEYYSILKDFEDVFKEIPGLLPKRDIDFSINMMPIEIPISKTPYIINTT